MNFKQRRNKLIDSLNQNSITVVFSGTSIPHSEDENYPFDVNRNFYYLTGLDRENMILLLSNIGGNYQQLLFIEPYDEFLAKWVGGRISSEEASSISGIKSVREIQSFDAVFGSLISRNRGLNKINLYLDMWHYSVGDTATKALEFAKKIRNEYPAIHINDLFKNITSLRMIKDNDEVNAIIRANEITNNGILAMMSYSKAGIYERELEKVFDLELAKQGCGQNAFPTIAAGGMNATTLHYSENKSKLLDGDLFLTDLGSAYNYYCSDVSRTFPVNGKFSNRQKEIYNVVLNGQKLVQSKARPGISTRQLNNILIEYYKVELPKINLNKPVSEYYFHGVSHQLGLDTHDVTLDYQAPLVAGNVISNEPGLYITDEGIGIRIEDDLLITEDGCKNLSSMIIKEISDIEKHMNK